MHRSRLLRGIITIALSVLAITTSAQTQKKLFVGTGLGALVKEKSGLTYQFSGSYGKQNDHIFFGFGMGIEGISVKNPEYNPSIPIPPASEIMGFFKHIKKFNGISVPLYANVKGIWDDRTFSPDFDFKAGLSTGFIYGPFAEAGVGCRYKLSSKTALRLGAYYKLGYEFEALISEDSHCEEETFRIVGLKIGFEF